TWRGLLSLSLFLCLRFPSPGAGVESRPLRSVVPEAAPRPLNRFLVRARALYRVGKADEAIATLQSALKLDSRFVPAHHLLGSLYLTRSELDSALRQFSQETRLAPQTVGGYFGMAEVYHRRRQYPLAASALEKVLKI